MRIAGFGFGEMMIVALIALALFGRRLPDVAQSLGRGVFWCKDVRYPTPRQWRRYLLELQIAQEEDELALKEFVRRVAPWAVGSIVLFLACLFLLA